MAAAFNQSAQFNADDLSSSLKKQDYILGGQSVIPQPMCESQLQSEITDEIRTEKFITLASKSAVRGYDFSQHDDMYASHGSSSRSSH